MTFQDLRRLSLKGCVLENARLTTFTSYRETFFKSLLLVFSDANHLRGADNALLNTHVRPQSTCTHFHTRTLCTHLCSRAHAEPLMQMFLTGSGAAKIKHNGSSLLQKQTWGLSKKQQGQRYWMSVHALNKHWFKEQMIWIKSIIAYPILFKSLLLITAAAISQFINWSIDRKWIGNYFNNWIELNKNTKWQVAYMRTNWISLDFGLLIRQKRVFKTSIYNWIRTLEIGTGIFLTFYRQNDESRK